MLRSCTHMATVDIKGLTATAAAAAMEATVVSWHISSASNTCFSLRRSAHNTRVSSSYCIARLCKSLTLSAAAHAISSAARWHSAVYNKSFLTDGTTIGRIPLWRRTCSQVLVSLTICSVVLFCCCCCLTWKRRKTGKVPTFFSRMIW